MDATVMNFNAQKCSQLNNPICKGENSQRYFQVLICNDWRVYMFPFPSNFFAVETANFVSANIRAYIGCRLFHPKQPILHNKRPWRNKWVWFLVLKAKCLFSQKSSFMKNCDAVQILPGNANVEEISCTTVATLDVMYCWYISTLIKG